MKDPNENTNGLCPAALERLALLLEECGEVIQIIGKIERYGYDGYHPDDPDCINKELLEKEIAHILVAIRLMKEYKDVSEEGIDFHWREKRKGINEHLLHNTL